MGGVVRFTEASSIALHAMTILAARPGLHVTTSYVATRLPVSEHHLAKVLQRLARAGLVESVRGPGGGYLLRRPAAEITLLDVHEAIEGGFVVASCVFSHPSCLGDCVLGDTVREANALVHARLARTSLADVVQTLAPVPSLVAFGAAREAQARQPSSTRP
jgi:Rrf2 family protein